MSLSGALSNAFSGLRANTRAATLVSTNIANATTESYGRRTLALSSAAAGTIGGVRIDGVRRETDVALLADRRSSDAASSYGDTMHAFSSRIEDRVGTSGEPGSLMGRLAAFENALLTASTNPASTQRLETVAVTAQGLATTLNDLSDEVQDLRMTADRTIGRQVALLNDTMARLEGLNDAVRSANVKKMDTASLLDERQRLLDGISDIVPLRVVEREHGEIAVFSRNGATLLDRSASVIGFATTPVIGPSETLGAGLSGLTLNGNAIESGPRGMFAGGDMAAQFAIRDEAAVSRQAELDGIARELIQRLEANPADPTIAAGDAGLFRDATAPINGMTGNYAAFDPADETGIAQRIMLHTEQVRPGDGTSWRIRDGIYAGAQGAVGDATVIDGIAGTLDAIAAPQSTVFGTVLKSLPALVADFTASAASQRVRDENEQTYLSVQNTALRELELAEGVDTDQELQILMQIEQHYAANAKVMTTIDDLMERLLSI